MVIPNDIAIELGKEAPILGTPEWDQWDRWIQRAYRAIQTRAKQVGVAYESLDPDVVDDAVIDVVARRVVKPKDGAESTTEQVQIDDGSLNRTRRYGANQWVGNFLDDWWDPLGLALPDADSWSGSIAYSRTR